MPATEVPPQANRLGRSQAIQSMGIGQTIDVPVVVHNWSTKQQSGAVSLDVPSDFTLDAASKAYDVAPGGAVLVRPDGYVAWRCRAPVVDPAKALREATSAILGH